ncbi:MAG: hypothetical protein R3E56_05515 [Burkholderiaceae bacterium]
MPDVRKGQSMHKGLEAGLAIDGMLTCWVSCSTADAVQHCATTVRSLLPSCSTCLRGCSLSGPFVPDKRTRPADWGDLLNTGVGTGGMSSAPANMRIVEDAFAYRLVWALEALSDPPGHNGLVVGDRFRRWKKASVETGVPNL